MNQRLSLHREKPLLGCLKQQNPPRREVGLLTLVLPTKIAKLTTLASYSIILLENRCLSNQPRPTKRLLAIQAPDDGPEVFEGEALLPEVQVLQPLKVGAPWELFLALSIQGWRCFPLKRFDIFGRCFDGCVFF